MLDSVETAIGDLKNGKMIIVVDDENRENEGDLIASSELLQPEDINFMIKFARGLVCTPMEKERLDELFISQMTNNNTDKKGTAFTISVDYKNGTTTGISAFDRYKTIKALIDKDSKPWDFTRPGHIFPLEAKKYGVLERPGHTEATIDLMKFAGLYPAGVICEIIKDNGEMSRFDDLAKFKEKYSLKMISVLDLIKYKQKRVNFIEKVSMATLPTSFGEFKIIVFKNLIDQKEHVALLKEPFDTNFGVLTRIHSSCFTGDLLGSKRCDCREQLYKSLELINKNGGVLLYLNQEGRGIGLGNKIKAYKLQEEGFDTVDANIKLGFKDDLRDYSVAAKMLENLNIKKIRLLTNNPKKVSGLKEYGIEILERVPLIIKSNNFNEKYLNTKKERMGHIF